MYTYFYATQIIDKCLNIAPFNSGQPKILKIIPKKEAHVSITMEFVKLTEYKTN